MFSMKRSRRGLEAAQDNQVQPTEKIFADRPTFGRLGSERATQVAPQQAWDANIRKARQKTRPTGDTLMHSLGDLPWLTDDQTDDRPVR